VTPAQQIALARPCYLAGETFHPRYRALGGAWTIVLTVNAGYE
jgi:hypothetical protein